MRLIFIIPLLLCFNEILHSQNLVPNGSFEEQARCPGDYTQSPLEFFVKEWQSASVGTPDYFNTCSHGEADVPHNWAGVADPYEGTAYVGIYLWMDTQTNYREYLQTELREPLIRDSTYYVTWHYKLSSYSKYSIDRIGLLFTDSAFRLQHDRVIRVVPTIAVVNDTALTPETGLWEEAKFVYKARGGEKFITLGNFSDDASTKSYRIQFRPAVQMMLSRSAYYYIDDVSVVSKFNEDQSALARVIPVFEKDDIRTNTNYVLRNINFQFNSFRLIPPSFSELDKLAQYLLENPKLNVQLFGHTDDQGSEGYNLKLSQARAKNVCDYLVSVGIARERIEYFGYGKNRPLQVGKSEADRAINRRVEIRFLMP